MNLRRSAKLVIVCLSLSALLTVTRDIWSHRLIVSGLFADEQTIFLIAPVIEVLLFHVPLIIFFLVFYREKNIER